MENSTETVSSNMAPFLTKLFQIVSNESTERSISWTAKGDSFVISDPDTFAKDILPTYFKHNNIRSFIRQLNTYGFRKRTNISSTDEHLEFFHEKFRRDQPALLMQIKRCHQPKPQSRPAANDDPSEMVKNLPDIDTIRNRVGELKSRLGALQNEVRDYNAQMEHKVDLLMQILQNSASPGPSLSLQGLTQAAPPEQLQPGSDARASAPPASWSSERNGAHHNMLTSNMLTTMSEQGLCANSNGMLSSGLLGSLNALSSHTQKSGEVAGLQSLLEAAQRYRVDEDKNKEQVIQLHARNNLMPTE